MRVEKGAQARREDLQDGLEKKYARLTHGSVVVLVDCFEKAPARDFHQDMSEAEAETA